MLDMQEEVNDVPCHDPCRDLCRDPCRDPYRDPCRDLCHVLLTERCGMDILEQEQAAAVAAVVDVYACLFHDLLHFLNNIPQTHSEKKNK